MMGVQATQIAPDAFFVDAGTGVASDIKTRHRSFMGCRLNS